MGILFDTPEKRKAMTADTRARATEIEIRKWAVQAALSLTDNERAAMGGVVSAATIIASYTIGNPLAPEGR